MASRCGRQRRVVAAVPAARPHARPHRLLLLLLVGGRRRRRISGLRDGRSASFAFVRQRRAVAHEPQNAPCAHSQRQCHSQSNILNAARMAELLRSPRRRSRVTELCQENTDE